eukprot:TRINITY_DN71471_c1_g1_i1.p3 TRINITY_DN71471_c1_g1~~TRINITY_DN71471_c1_g1_i1.p3  ORF type:complete len:250 (+),score=25.81 TRINITY_DN71471_c1_g1_i1:5953-6702(+)
MNEIQLESGQYYNNQSKNYPKMQTLEHWGESQGYIRYASQKTGLKPGFITLIIIVSALLILYQGIVGGFVLFFLGVVIPAYQSFKAIESPNKEDDSLMLKYWCVFSLFLALDGFFQPVLAFIPLVGIVKFGLIAALSMNNYAGSTLVYNMMVAPILRIYQVDIDKAYVRVEQTMTEVAEAMKDTVSQTVKEGAEKVGGKVSDFAGNVSQSVKENVEKAAEKVGEKVSDIAGDVKETISPGKKTKQLHIL